MQQLTSREIEALVGRHPLRPGVPDAVLNRNELAEFFGVSALTITNWINDGMPVLSKGGQGQAYEFQASACWAWKQQRDQAEDERSASARAAIEAQRLALIGGGVGDSIEALPPKERREIIEAQIQYERWLTARNQLLHRADVEQLLTGLFAMIRDTMELAPDRVERIEIMPPRAVAAFIDVCDSLLDELHRTIEAWIASKPLTASPPVDLLGHAVNVASIPQPTQGIGQ